MGQTATEADEVHPVELSVYSIMSSELDELYQSIDDLRQSQALLVLTLRKLRDSLRSEHSILQDKTEMIQPLNQMKELDERLAKIRKRFDLMLSRNNVLAKSEE
ncbi:hypothetical protein NCAS_0G02760 [Naumovozyma castellii]|uniref:Biogenesis of lysosome-related organelles complex 1 subunit SNN1 n=1 Tax=Naumovozyma castellii TaxID=27288 RepID=G0VIC8_NAUCA|nr:hypothetical protein NCAS_0G02760 [Naumovozyma castellii CBS 4309]CCC71163.1 hypothetical protein NCAS_0G02760 [Naumovozyma castellii CBS 4309]